MSDKHGKGNWQITKDSIFFIHWILWGMKPSQVSNVKIIWPKTPLGPFWRFPEMVNLISSVIIAILSYRKDFTTLYNRIRTIV